MLLVMGYCRDLNQGFAEYKMFLYFVEELLTCCVMLSWKYNGLYQQKPKTKTVFITPDRKPLVFSITQLPLSN